jgi:hypothetical protein
MVSFNLLICMFLFKLCVAVAVNVFTFVTAVVVTAVVVTAVVVTAVVVAATATVVFVLDVAVFVFSAIDVDVVNPVFLLLRLNYFFLKFLFSFFAVFLFIFDFVEILLFYFYF